MGQEKKIKQKGQRKERKKGRKKNMQFLKKLFITFFEQEIV